MTLGKIYSYDVHSDILLLIVSFPNYPVKEESTKKKNRGLLTNIRFIQQYQVDDSQIYAFQLLLVVPVSIKNYLHNLSTINMDCKMEFHILTSQHCRDSESHCISVHEE